MRIQNKLFLTLLLTSLGVISIMFALVRWNVDQGMLQYVNAREAEQIKPILGEVIQLYRQEGSSWDNIKQNPRLVHSLLRSHMRSLADRADRRGDLRRGNHKHQSQQKPRHPPAPKLAILSQNKQVVFGRFDPNRPHHLLAIDLDGKTIGWLTRPQRQRFTEGFELSFIQQQQKALIIISGLALILSAIFSLPLARHFVLPLRSIGQSVHQLTQGNYSGNGKLKPLKKRRDELGELATDIHELTHTLHQNDSSRKRWLADTSHELRTPISILLGEMEAMMDGVRDINKKNIQSLFLETKQLHKLIDDLQTLNNADIGGLSYRKTNCNIIDLIEEQCQLHQSLLDQHQLSLHKDFPSKAIHCHIDSTRIAQLIANIFGNCIKYCHPNNRIDISINSNQQMATIRIADNGPGVPPQALAQLFDHLYRVEDSRNRDTGGSGLGLAICKRIVEGHHGDIIAKHTSSGGLTIEFTLPQVSP